MLTIDTIDASAEAGAYAVQNCDQFNAYATAQAFYRLADRLAVLADTLPVINPLRIYSEARLAGVPEPWADMFSSRIEIAGEAALGGQCEPGLYVVALA